MTGGWGIMPIGMGKTIQKIWVYAFYTDRSGGAWCGVCGENINFKGFYELSISADDYPF
jgi:hypothetical protein